MKLRYFTQYEVQGVFLDMPKAFGKVWYEKIQKAGIAINIIKSLNNILPRQALLTVYKLFIRPHLDYGGVIYDEPDNESLCQTIDGVQYKVALAITDAINGTSQDKLYKELGLETLKFRQWCRRLCIHYKVRTSGLPLYLLKYMPKGSHSYNIRLNKGGPNTYHCRTDVSNIHFFHMVFQNGRNWTYKHIS